MLYKCGNCRRKFHFDDEIEFCPYCGKPLFHPETVCPESSDEALLVQRIDAIWGDEARIRKEFSNAVLSYIYLINEYAEQAIEGALPKQNISQYARNYAAIKQSNNRKTLITRIDHFLDSLDMCIDDLRDRVPMNTVSKLEEAHRDVEKAVKELYDFLGFRYIPPRDAAFFEEQYSAAVLFSKEQLRCLYELVLAAYSKYKKCVADNNMFAAFASTSDYGVLERPWYAWLAGLNRDKDDGEEEKELPAYHEVVDYMKQQNAKKYFGMLDEDFVPHVDAFWHGLEMLCVFIDNHIRVDYCAASSRVAQEERDRILRNISGSDFNVSNERLEELLELKKRLEEKRKQQIATGRYKNECT